VVQVRFFQNRAGQRLAYRDDGDGPLVVLPAWWVSHLERDADDPDYCRFFARLADHLRVVRYDRIGVGLSDRTRRSYTLESELDDVAALIDHLGVTRCHLLGFSCAGPIALAYAAQYPERVDRIVLYGSYVCGETLSPKEVRDALIGLVRAPGRLGTRTLADVFHPAGDAESRSRFNDIQRASADAETAARLLELAYALDSRPFVDQVRAPVLVLHRKDDFAVRHGAARTLCASLKDAALTTLPGSSHQPWLGDGDGVADAILAFFAAAASRRVPSAATGELRRDGEVWRLRFGGRQALLRDCKGLADLVRLLEQPGEHIHVLDLVGADPAERRDAARGDVTVDRQALADYRHRLDEIDDELANAESCADLGRVGRLAAEREALLHQLAADTGRKGRARRLNDPVERARKAVTARLRDAIRRVKAADPALGEHLEEAIQTGVYCTYRPAQPVAWAVSPVSS
jgi:pimeloyl-ACP methyl ester carboxylesterase